MESMSSSARPLPSLVRSVAAAGAADCRRLVVGAPDARGEPWVHGRMPPLTQLARRNSSGDRQSLVANVDTAMLVMGLDGDFNLRRLERYLAMVKPAGIWPVVILTKRDLCHDVDARLDALRERLPTMLPCTRSTRAATAAELAPYHGAGQTIVVLGSSGAGKSALTNTLLGVDVQSTGRVREGDDRGRHTTTSRSLHVLFAGGMHRHAGIAGLQPISSMIWQQRSTTSASWH